MTEILLIKIFLKSYPITAEILLIRISLKRTTSTKQWIRISISVVIYDEDGSDPLILFICQK